MSNIFFFPPEFALCVIEYKCLIGNIQKYEMDYVTFNLNVFWVALALKNRNKTQKYRNEFEENHFEGGAVHHIY